MGVPTVVQVDVPHQELARSACLLLHAQTTRHAPVDVSAGVEAVVAEWLEAAAVTTLASSASAVDAQVFAVSFPVAQQPHPTSSFAHCLMEDDHARLVPLL